MQLVVKPLLADEPVAALERNSMTELDLEHGDYVLLEGRAGRTAVAEARVRPSEEGPERTIRLHRELIETLDVDVGDVVDAEPADVRSAERIEIALPRDVTSDEALALSRRDALAGRVLSSDRTVSVSPSVDSSGDRPDRRVPIEIVDADPDGFVRVEEWTSVVVSPDPATISTTRAETETETGGDRSAPESGRTARAESTERTISSVTYDDIGGLEDELAHVREVVELPIRYPDLFARLGVDPPNGVLLYGPPGTGKTLVARAMANEVGAHFETISGPEIVSKYYGESEERLREVFETAAENAPAIVFVDELDAIAPRRDDAAGNVERRIVAQLLSLLDGADDAGRIVVVGTTNRVDSIDPALRRPGRFDREIEIGVPDAEARAEILRIHARDVSLAPDVDLERYAEQTHGFVGADLENLLRESAMCALRRLREAESGDEFELPTDRLESVEIGDADVESALRGVEPSAMREVFVEVPDVGWEDIGGLEGAKRTLREAVQWPLEHPAAFERLALRPATGVLLHGPPGTGKTLLARAVANEAQSNFISIKGPELVDKYVGESERGIRDVFSKARQNAPTVLLFDEIDAIAGTRGGSSDSNVGERVVSQLLTELDGLEELEDVVVLATTNRPELIDDALLRAGRFEERVFVGPPDESARREIFEIHLRDRPLASDVDLDSLAARTDGAVGSDIQGLCRAAAMNAVGEYVRGATDAGDEPAPGGDGGASGGRIADEFGREPRRRSVDDLEVTGAHLERALDAFREDDESIDPFAGLERE
ncbi:CDC48 family AAA ATPase [Natrialbaceae archaeon GCM10025810]|uniref:CDC48 family AAA ATPase n=1 Tax=Halovalidus salilacus TaxID=3075124 RepID=UPI00361011E8